MFATPVSCSPSTVYRLPFAVLLAELFHHPGESLAPRPDPVERQRRQGFVGQAEERHEVLLLRLDVDEPRQELVLLLRLVQQVEGPVLVGRVVILPELL